VRWSAARNPRGALAKQLALGSGASSSIPATAAKTRSPGFIPGVHEKDVVLEIAKR